MDQKTCLLTFAEHHLSVLMNVAYHDAFMEGYLLVLMPGENSDAGLAHYLDRACRSGKPAVWIDCRLLDTVSATDSWLLWACQYRLRRRQVRLVFCNVSEQLAQTLRRVFTCGDLCIVPSLNDAAALTYPGINHPGT